jgi:hypothetical protein
MKYNAMAQRYAGRWLLRSGPCRPPNNEKINAAEVIIIQ